MFSLSLLFLQNSQLWICRDVWVFLPFLQLSQITYVYVPLQLNLTMKVKVAQSCPTLCDPMDCIDHGILQARILEWIASPFSRGIFPTQGSNPGLPHCGGFFTSWATREAPTSPWRALLNLMTFGHSRMTILMPDIVSGTEETAKEYWKIPAYIRGERERLHQISNLPSVSTRT